MDSVKERTTLDEGAKQFLSQVLGRSISHGFHPFAVPLDLCVLLIVRKAAGEEGTIDGRFLHAFRPELRLALDDLLPMYWGVGSANPYNAQKDV